MVGTSTLEAQGHRFDPCCNIGNGGAQKILLVNIESTQTLVVIESIKHMVMHVNKIVKDIIVI